MPLVEDEPELDQATSAEEERGEQSRGRRRRRSSADVGRRFSQRVSREELLNRAGLLPEPGRTILNAHYALGMPMEEIALLHKVTLRQLQRRMARLRESLSDPCFVLAARFSERLPAELGQLARDHWIGAATLRELATARGETLHRVRQDIGVARSLLVVAMAEDQFVPPELARAVIESRRG